MSEVIAMQQASFGLFVIGIAVALFLGMLLFLEVGRRLGRRQFARHGEAARSGVGAVDSAVYSLLALLLGFAFSGATSRFDSRRQLIVQEVSAVSTGWQRLDALPPAPQPEIRTDFRRYVDALLASHAEPPGSAGEARALGAVRRAQDDMWARAVAACLTPDGEKARMLVLPALNDMFDAAEKERLARYTHPPSIIYLMLVITALAAALFAGYAMSSATTRNWVHIIGVAATISLATYVIIELEFPHRGWIRVDAIERTLVELRASMK